MRDRRLLAYGIHPERLKNHEDHYVHNLVPYRYELRPRLGGIGESQMILTHLFCVECFIMVRIDDKILKYE